MWCILEINYYFIIFCLSVSTKEGFYVEQVDIGGVADEKEAKITVAYLLFF